MKLYLVYFLLIVSHLSSCQNIKDNAKLLNVVNSKAKDTIKSLKKYKDSDWVELKTLDSSFIYDLRYATKQNFVHKKMYPCAKCYVRYVVAKALLNIQKELKNKSLSLKFFDCYRPIQVQKKLWKIKPDPHYVANPKKGSMHNRGVAIDVTIVDKNNKELNMGTPFDFFGKEAYQDYKYLPDTIKKNRLLLKELMQKNHLEPITSEWWHYSYRLKDYPIENWMWHCNEKKLP